MRIKSGMTLPGLGIVLRVACGLHLAAQLAPAVMTCYPDPSSVSLTGYPGTSQWRPVTVQCHTEADPNSPFDPDCPSVIVYAGATFPPSGTTETDQTIHFTCRERCPYRSGSVTVHVSATADPNASTDTTPPGAVADLATSSPTPGSLTLTWTAPGDDGNTGQAIYYDIRYSTSMITSANWNIATRVTGEPLPAPAGTSQSMVVSGLTTGTTYYFAMKTADEPWNVSALSNVASGTPPVPPDTTAPATVTDLVAVSAVNGSLKLMWTAPGDDGHSGTAASYDIRYSTSPIMEANWAAATPVANEPPPAAAGEHESMSIPGLTAGTTYYVAMKARDAASNESGLSDVFGCNMNGKGVVAFIGSPDKSIVKQPLIAGAVNPPPPGTPWLDPAALAILEDPAGLKPGVFRVTLPYFSSEDCLWVYADVCPLYPGHWIWIWRQVNYSDLCDPAMPPDPDETRGYWGERSHYGTIDCDGYPAFDMGWISIPLNPLTYYRLYLQDPSGHEELVLEGVSWKLENSWAPVAMRPCHNSPDGSPNTIWVGNHLKVTVRPDWWTLPASLTFENWQGVIKLAHHAPNHPINMDTFGGGVDWPTAHCPGAARGSGETIDPLTDYRITYNDPPPGTTRTSLDCYFDIWPLAGGIVDNLLVCGGELPGRLIVVEADIDFGSANTEEEKDTEDHWIPLNDDNDVNPLALLWDWNEPGADPDDLRPVHLHVAPAPIEDDDGTVTLTWYKYGSGPVDIKVWEDPNRTTELGETQDGVVWTATWPAVGFTDKIVYVEGIKAQAGDAGAQLGSVDAMWLSYKYVNKSRGSVSDCTDYDQIHVKVLQIDADVNSDNTGTVDGSDYEDRIEDASNLAGYPGVIILANDDNDDGDFANVDMATDPALPGADDRFDGYNSNGQEDDTDDANQLENDFKPMYISLIQPLNPGQDLADSRVSITVHGGNATPGTLNGRIRLWMCIKDDEGKRDPRPVLQGGDWLQDGEYWGRELGLGTLTHQSSLMVYIEGIVPSDLLGDVEIECRLDPGGPQGPVGYQHTDKVRITVISASIAVKDYRMVNNTPVPFWTDRITAVAGDEVTFRAASDCNPLLVDYAWDWWESDNSDSTDANRNGVDEFDDDTEDTFRIGTHSWTIPYLPPYPYSQTAYRINGFVQLSLVDEWWIRSRWLTLYLNEALICSAPGNDPLEQYQFDVDAVTTRNTMNAMHYRTTLATGILFGPAIPGSSPPRTQGDNLFPYHNIFYFIDHGTANGTAPSASQIQFGDVSMSALRGFLASHYTPEGAIRSYRFVFLNCCNSAVVWGPPGALSWRDEFRAETFLGWVGEVARGHMLAFSTYFWNAVSDGTRQTVQSATDYAREQTWGWVVTDDALPQCQGNVGLVLQK